MNVKKTSFAAVLLALGLSSPVIVCAAVDQPSEYPLELAANETDNNTLAAVTEEAAAIEELPEMSMEELQAEIQKACDELAIDEKVTEENRAAFIEDCVSENTPIEGAPTDEMAVDPNMEEPEVLDDASVEEEPLPEDAEADAEAEAAPAAE